MGVASQTAETVGLLANEVAWKYFPPAPPVALAHFFQAGVSIYTRNTKGTVLSVVYPENAIP